MAADRDAGVDPRFDPVFQRGYDPTVHGARRPRAVPRHATAPTPVATARPKSPMREASDAASTVSAADVAETPESSDRPFAAAPAAESDDTLRPRNPFRLALLVASILSIGGACLLIWNRIEENPYYQGFSGADVPSLFRSQLTEAALVPLLTAGLLGLALWLAIGALGHRRRIDE
jgi:hypothetical protein